MKLIPIRNKPNLYRHPATGIIYFKMYRKGLGQCERSTGEKALARAIEEAEKIRSDFLGHKYVEKNVNKKRLVFSELWAEFLETKETKSKGTYVSMEVQGRLHLIPFFGNYFPHEIDEALWAKYVTYSRIDTPSRKLFNDWKYLRMFLNYLVRTERLSRVREFKNPDLKRKKGKVYSDDEIARLLKSASGALKLQILMALTMGM